KEPFPTIYVDSQKKLWHREQMK
nr:tRNA-guanine transglycosylase, 65 K chain - bovine (fragments) [Bos taurus]